MAKGKKTGGRDFQPGQSGNPSGRPPEPEDIKKARSLTKNEYTRIANKYLWMDLESFGKELKRKDLSMFEKAVMQMIQHAAAGCERRFEQILARMIGKPRDKMEVTLPQPFIVRYADGSKAAELGASVREEE